MTCGDVPVLSTSADASHGRDPEQMAEVHVDIRKLLQFLAGQQSTPTKAVCSECALASFFGPVVSRVACDLCRVAVGRLGAEAGTRGPPCRWGRRACVSPGAGARGGPGFRVETCVEALTVPPPQELWVTRCCTSTCSTRTCLCSTSSPPCPSRARRGPRHGRPGRRRCVHRRPCAPHRSVRFPGFYL